MDRELIISSAEWCSDGGACKMCPYKNKGSDCIDALMKDQTSLIKELTEENKNLKKLLDSKCDDCIARERANTVRKMHERLKKYIESLRETRDMVMFPFTEGVLMGLEFKFDQIAKEMIDNERPTDD